VVFALAETTRLRGAIYSGFRYASPVELFVGSPAGGSRTTIVPNPELAPERLLGGEMGVDYTPSRRLVLRTTVFRAEVEDLIQRIVVGSVGAAGGVLEPCGELPPLGRCSQFRTVGEIHSTGLEIGADFRPADRWRLTLDATLMESRIARDPVDPSLEGNQVERAPDQQIAGAVEFREPRWGAILLRGRYVADAYDDAENLQFLPSHTLVDLAYSREIGPRWQLFAGVENLLDERYVNRFAGLGREISAPRLWHVGFRVRTGG
jgi:outer membrane receptor protein involved in Fe transport